MNNIANDQKKEWEIEVPEENKAAEEKKTEDVVMPFEYAEDEHYYVEDLGVLKKKPFYSFVKRTFDIFASLFGLIICAIPMLIIAIAIKCSSKGPVFYSQERLGLNRKKFMLVKFRTMVADAEKQGAQWSQGYNDTRITKVGSILRKTRLDELPQLWACLTGKLSIVGPRPEREVFYNKFEEHVHGFSERLKVRPGLTGLAQVSGGYDLRPEEKVVHDVEYIKNRSLRMEIKILFKTVKVVFTHDGAK
ncbi:MAG: sugar transferase [Clostridia bacterium]|nr:sugar transferase [Clostridia bacterium]